MVEVIHIKKEVIVQVASKNNREGNELLCRRFNSWLDNALKGDKFCYFQGAYISGHDVGGYAFDAYEHGKITLFQEKKPPNYHYWAMRL